MEKTKCYTKTLLYILLCLLMALSFAGCSQARTRAYAAAYKCLGAFDFEGAEAYAKKLPERYSMHNTIECIKQFKKAYDAGNWPEAIDIYNRYSDQPRSGEAFASYLDCYYHTLAEPAEVLLERGETEAAVESLLQFHNRFHAWNPHYSSEEHAYIGTYSIYTEFFPQNAEHYQQLVERAGKTALSDGETDTLALLAGFQDDRTVSFQEYGWSADYLIWQTDDEITRAATPFNTCRTLVEGGKADEAYKIMTGYLRPRILDSAHYPYFPHWAKSEVEGTDLADLKPFEAFASVFAGYEASVPYKAWKCLLTETLNPAEDFDLSLSRLDTVAAIERNAGADFSLQSLTWLNELSDEQLGSIGTAPSGKALVIVTTADALRQYGANVNTLGIDTAQIPFYDFRQAADFGAMTVFPKELYPQGLEEVEYVLEVALDMRDSGATYYRADTKEEYDANSYRITARVRLWRYGPDGEKTMLREWDEIAGDSATGGEASQRAMFGSYPAYATEDIFGEAAQVMGQ